jgi:hypothetical protein
MARTEALTHEEVCAVIQSWGTGTASDLEMHLWATNNYFPLHQQVAPGQPDRVALAIGIVLTEFECAKPPYPFQRNVAAAALAFILARDSEFEQRRSDFDDSLASGGNAL